MGENTPFSSLGPSSRMPLSACQAGMRGHAGPPRSLRSRPPGLSLAPRCPKHKKYPPWRPRCSAPASFLLLLVKTRPARLKGWKAVLGEERATRPDLPLTTWVDLGKKSSSLGLFPLLHDRDYNLPHRFVVGVKCGAPVSCSH